MLKSINQWAFPYPQRMDLRECMQLAKDAGFDGIELNYDLENDLSPKSGTKEYQAIRKNAEDIRHGQGLATTLREGDRLTIVPAIAGGWS